DGAFHLQVGRLVAHHSPEDERRPDARAVDVRTVSFLRGRVSMSLRAAPDAARDARAGARGTRCDLSRSRGLIMIRRWFIACAAFVLTVVPTLFAQAPPGPDSQSGFVPISELPPSQQLPAAPFLIAAYAFIWVALMAYLWSIWRRL